MEANLPVWKYYEKGFVDPLYALYQRKLVPGRIQSTGREVGVSVNPFTTPADPLYSNPLLERKGWSQTFQRQFSYDPCPAGWTSGTDGSCFTTEPEDGVGIFYTKDAYVPQHQYFLGYAEPVSTEQGINEFDNRSVSPFTGKFQSEPPSFVPSFAQNYDRNPTSVCYV